MSGRPTAFLLSPASLTGIRARQLASPRAGFELARRFREDTLEIGEAFAFLSALYFRAKLAYARRFATAGAWVIAPGYGLVPPEWLLDRDRWRRMRRVRVDPERRAYRRPLEEAVRALAPDSAVVLLGSVATGKYVDVLEPVLGGRLFYPRVFRGLGDMSRGSLMLKAVASGVELDYVVATERISRP